MQALLESVRGAELLGFVEDLCDDRGIGAGWVRAVGELESVELVVAGRTVALDGATLVSFDGSVARVGDHPTVRAFGVVTASPSGVAVTVGGEIRRAVCADVELAVVPFDGVRATRRAEPDGSARLETGSSAAAPRAERAPDAAGPRAETGAGEPARPRREPPKPAPEPKPAKAAPAAPSPEPAPAAKETASDAGGAAKGWAAVAEASARVAAGSWDDDDGEVDVDELERGDILLHPQLAECRVVMVINDDAVKVQLPGGSVRKLMMRGFRLFRERDNVFRIERKP